MTTRIRATCPTCGDVDLPPEQVRLRRVRDGGGAVTTGSDYRFRCPACAHEVVKAADDRVVTLLATGGVVIDDVPAPAARSDAPALTADDLLDLHLALREPDWFARFAAGAAHT